MDSGGKIIGYAGLLWSLKSKSLCIYYAIRESYADVDIERKLSFGLMLRGESWHLTRKTAPALTVNSVECLKLRGLWLGWQSAILPTLGSGVRVASFAFIFVLIRARMRYAKWLWYKRRSNCLAHRGYV